MAETRCWFDWMKLLFLCRPNQNPEKKPKKWRCIFRRISFKRPSATTVGVSTNQDTRTLDEASERQMTHALYVAFVAAVAAAAEAAAASARAAAEVVRLSATSSPISHHYHCCVRSSDPNSAAIRIQTAFRAYLARKAFRALKALVRLQAIARGRAVRRRITFNFGRSDSLWDCSAFKEEDLDAIWLRRQEGVIKRERTLKYSVSHQERRSPQQLAEHLTQQNAIKRIHPNQETTRTRNPSPTKVKTGKFRDSNMGQDSSSSFSQRSVTDEEQNSGNREIRVLSSEYYPTYMAATESAKAKVRCSSAPRQRLGVKKEDWLQTPWDCR